MTFDEAVAAYEESVAALGLPVTRLQAESHVESLQDWSETGDLESVRSWFVSQRASNPMRVTKIRFDECRGWHTDEETGYVVHDSGEFFAVEAIEVTMSASREVGAGGWCQPVLTQVGDDGGVLGLLRTRVNGAPHYLVQAKAEPGNYRLVSLSPAVQATFSNLKRAHGGSLPIFASYFYPEPDPAGTVIARAWLSEDGGRLFNKRNLGIVLDIEDGASLDLRDDFRWVSMWQVKQLFSEDAWVNPHLFRLISMVGA